MSLSTLQRYGRESLRNLWLYKLRSVLTLLGVLIGTAAVVALTSSGQAATEQALAQFKTLGTDLLAITVQTAGDESGGNQSAQKWQVADVMQIPARIPEITQAAPYTLDFSPLFYEGKNVNGNVVGVTGSLSQIIKISLASGRFISLLDQKQYFCVIGSGIAEDLRQLGAFHVLGQQLRIGNRYFTIIGIANPWPENMFMYADINRSVLIPIQTAFELSPLAQIQNVLFQLKAGAVASQIQPSLQRLVDEKLPNAKLFTRSAKELITSMQKQKQTFTVLLGVIGGISLLVGGIGVMNIMLVAVIERKREIGIRLAIGATPNHIRLMFLTDALVLTVCGGLFGVVIGEILSFAIAKFSHWTFHLYATPVIVGFGVSVLIGLFFGYYPAYQASCLDPIETLRAD